MSGAQHAGQSLGKLFGSLYGNNPRYRDAAAQGEMDALRLNQIEGSIAESIASQALKRAQADAALYDTELDQSLLSGNYRGAAMTPDQRAAALALRKASNIFSDDNGRVLNNYLGGLDESGAQAQANVGKTLADALAAEAFGRQRDAQALADRARAGASDAMAQRLQRMPAGPAPRLFTDANNRFMSFSDGKAAAVTEDVPTVLGPGIGTVPRQVMAPPPRDLQMADLLRRYDVAFPKNSAGQRLIGEEPAPAFDVWLASQRPVTPTVDLGDQISQNLGDLLAGDPEAEGAVLMEDPVGNRAWVYPDGRVVELER